MARECYICGKKPVSGRSITTRGVPKKRGGIGKKTTGISFRRFSPNLQYVSIMAGGKKKKVRVCAKCIKAGKAKKA